jgi:hypothetical protein
MAAVIIRLEVINEEDAGESNAYRYLTLEAPSYSVRIGRGSRSGSKDLEPAENNAWFDSRVMSREHAILKANLSNKTVTIEDVGSMHGTYLPADDLKLSKYQPQVVRDGDAIIFGAEVSRGPGKQASIYPPLWCPSGATDEHFRYISCTGD